ncbi:MAG: hypothetical protein ABF946_11105, partial [Acetobacter papayae]
PLSPQDKTSPLYEAGVSCPTCHGQWDAKRHARHAEREHQTRLAAARGDTHLGANMEEERARKRQRQEENIRHQNAMREGLE